MTAQTRPDRRRLFLECSGTYRVDRSTGIPRVARNVIHESLAQAAARGIEVIPIFHGGREYRRAMLTSDGRLASLPQPAPERGAALRHAYRVTLHRLSAAVPHPGAREWLNAPGTRPSLTRQLKRLARAVRPQAALASANVQLEHEPVTFRAGDILLLVDLYIDDDRAADLRALRARGVTIGTLVYDLIPLSRTGMWFPEFIVGFRTWFEMVLECADVIVSISETVRDEVAAYASRNHPPFPRPAQRNAFFHLGHELDRRSSAPSIRAELVELLSKPRVPVFLNVGWFDPRKNQPFLIDALDDLWSRGIESKLLLVGKQGRGTVDIMRHLRRRRRSAGRVSVLHDLSDDELAYCYSHVDALVYPTVEEGFGLPLVEALSHGLPVFASDIPVFRELAADYAVFFGLDSTDELTGQLERFCLAREYPSRRPVGEFRWPDWRESVTRLLDIVLEPRDAASSP